MIVVLLLLLGVVDARAREVLRVFADESNLGKDLVSGRTVLTANFTPHFDAESGSTVALVQSNTMSHVFDSAIDPQSDFAVSLWFKGFATHNSLTNILELVALFPAGAWRMQLQAYPTLVQYIVDTPCTPGSHAGARAFTACEGYTSWTHLAFKMTSKGIRFSGASPYKGSTTRVAPCPSPTAPFSLYITASDPSFLIRDLRVYDHAPTCTDSSYNDVCYDFFSTRTDNFTMCDGVDHTYPSIQSFWDKRFMGHLCDRTYSLGLYGSAPFTKSSWQWVNGKPYTYTDIWAPSQAFPSMPSLPCAQWDGPSQGMVAASCAADPMMYTVCRREDVPSNTPSPTTLAPPTSAPTSSPATPNPTSATPTPGTPATPTPGT
eukprot:Sspe_Gene.113049::Locus_96932_Transcript_1_1_Confidence_1.000_Length_1159::g.113049::m.113049